MKRISFLLPLLFIACTQTGIICNAPDTRCGQICVNLTTDPDHCGACGVTCSTGFQCAGSACACPTGLSACDQSCVDLGNNVGSCGACGNTCAEGMVCEDGGCITSCTNGLSVCGGGCADLTSDRQNCGGCADGGGAVCAQGESCHAGVCAPDLYVACYGSGKLHAMDGQGEGVSPDSASAPPSTPIALALAGPADLLVADDTAALLYDFALDGGFAVGNSSAVGQGVNSIATSGSLAVTVNSTDATVQIFALPLQANTDGGTAFLPANSYPQYAALAPDAVFVSLYGNVLQPNDTVGNQIARVSLADLSVTTLPVTGNLHVPDGGANQARPQGLAIIGTRLFAGLGNLDLASPTGPGLVAVFDLFGDGGFAQLGDPIVLGDGCVNTGALLANGTDLLVACGETYAPDFTVAAPGALAGLDTNSLTPLFAPVTFGCAQGSTGCTPGGPLRMAIADGKLFLGDSANGRVFVANPHTGAIERGADNAIAVCLAASDGGFDRISDIVARP